MEGRPKVTQATLLQDLRELGLQSGDTVLVRADLGELGRVRGGVGAAVMGALKDAVGPEGTLVALSFTRTLPLLRLDREYVFRSDTPSTAGALARLFLEDPEVRRSRHPTNSFAAIGARAEQVLAGHDETAPSFLPMAQLIALGGRQLLIGCGEASPGFTTVHWAQHQLGLASRSLLRNRFGVRYEKDGQVRVFKRGDFGGCSMGFGKLYPLYRAQGALRQGRVGNADSLCVDAAPAYRLELELLRRDPLAVLCDNPLCPWCRGSWLYNKRDMPGFYPRYALYQLRRLLRRGA